MGKEIRKANSYRVQPKPQAVPPPVPPPPWMWWPQVAANAGTFPFLPGPVKRADVAIFDDVCTAWGGSTSTPDDTKPIGGSEKGLFLLANGLYEAGLTTVLVRRDPQDTLHVRCLIISRRSSIPAHIVADRTVVYATDAEPDGYTHLQHFPFQFVSEFQRSRFRADPRDVVIPPILDEDSRPRRDEPRPVTVEGRWIYASGAWKGLEETLKCWEAEKPPGAKELVVCNPGWGEPEQGLCEKYGARYLGQFSPTEMARQIGMSEGMFYVNTQPECFPVLVAIAKAFGLKMHVRCSGHDRCGIADALLDQDLTAPAIIPRWIEFLGLSDKPSVLVDGGLPGVRAERTLPVPLTVSVICMTRDRHDWHESIYTSFDSQAHAHKDLYVLDDSPSPSPFFQQLRDPRVHYECLAPWRVTNGCKLNWAIEKSSGAVIAQFDDDDWYAPNYLSSMLDRLVRADADFVKLDRWNERREHDGRRWLQRPRELGGMWGYGFSYVYRRYVASRIHHPDYIGFSHDYVFVLGLQRAGLKTELIRDGAGWVEHLLHGRNASRRDADSDSVFEAPAASECPGPDPRHYTSIGGMFDFDDVYDLALDRYGRGPARFVEVGSFLGRSTCYMAERIKQRGLSVAFSSFDPWAGNDDGWAALADNLRRAEVSSLVDIHRRPSPDASAAFADRSLDFVFVDGSHELDAVRRDLEAWWPKLKPGGLFAGHDYGQGAVDRRRGGAGWNEPGTPHPGVVQAVDEFAASRGLPIRVSRSSWLIDVPVQDGDGRAVPTVTPVFEPGFDDAADEIEPTLDRDPYT